MDIGVVQRQLGLRLKELRLAKGLRQEDLDRWDFSYRYYGKLERGIVNPTLATLIRLCEIFDVTLPELLSFMENKGMVSEDREAVIMKLSSLLRENKNDKIKKLKLFLDEILIP